MSYSSTGDPTCTPLAGTVAVRQLAVDCYQHESGVGSCADTVDATLHAVSSFQDTTFQLDGDVLTDDRWVAAACSD
jgi:hypothetical protein